MLTPAWRQFRILSRLFGARHLLRIKRKYDEAFPYVRGYMVTSSIWALMECGFLEALQANGVVDPRAFAEERGLAYDVLAPLLVYLDQLRILRREDGGYGLDEAGERLMQEPLGLFELFRGYKPVMDAVLPLLRGDAQYPRDVQRDSAHVARGSSRLGAHLPFPMMRDLMQSHGKFHVLDLGCGNLDLLLTCCEDPRFECWGIDNDPVVVAQAQHRLATHPARDRIHVVEADMFDLAARAADWQTVDALCAIDVFHEHLWEGPEKVLRTLGDLRAQFPQAWLFVAEFCHPSSAWLRKHPTPLLDHEVCHGLTRQRIQSGDAWVALFERAGYQVAEARVFPFLGLGYFALS